MSKKIDNLLEPLINEPEREFHVRELARLTETAPTTVSKYLAELEKEGVLVSRRKLHHLLFRANVSSQTFKDRKLAYNIAAIRNSGLVEYLTEQFNYPAAIVLFGSFRKAENISTSDIDLLVITPSKKDVDLSKFEKKLGYKIQLFQHSNKELEAMKIKNKDLLNNMVNGLILEGFWELFK